MNISTLEEHMKRTVKIIVVGAGIAGLSAAERLIKRGFTNVEVFEASDRIGGRIYTQDFGDGWVEMGAQWIHGEKDNVAYQHAARRHLIQPPDDQGSVESDGSDSASDNYMPRHEEVFCTAAEGVLRDQKAVYAAYDFIADKLENCPADEHEPTPATPSGGRLHLQQYVEQEFEQLLHQEDKESKTRKTEAEEALNRAVLEWFKKFQCTMEGCDSLDQLSLDSFLENEECQGDMWINFKQGYRSLVTSVAENIPGEGVVRLRRVVTNIRLAAASSADDKQDDRSVTGSQRAVQVRCRDGSLYDADHVVVTVPLGYLKEHAHDMFDPPLSDSKMKAIQKMGFGTVDKIFLEFEEPVAKPGIDGYFLLWPETQCGPEAEAKEREDYAGQSSESTPAWWRHIHSIVPGRFASNVLSCWIYGSAARHVEALPDDHVQRVCTEIIRRFTNKDKMPKVKSMTRSKWSQNEFSRGSNTFLTSELPSANKSCRVLSEPIPAYVNGKERPAILFAGEATHPYYFSTVHGAMESGRREAVRIMSSYAPKRTTRYERLDSGTFQRGNF